MAEVSLSLSAITLNVNGLKSLIKGRDWQITLIKHDPTIFYIQICKQVESEWIKKGIPWKM